MNVEDLYRLLRTGHVQAQAVVDTIDEPLLVLDERGCVVEANRAFLSTFFVERDETLGIPLRQLREGQWNIPELDRLLVDIIPKSTAVIDYEVSHDFPRLGRRTFLLTARRMWRADGNSMQILLGFNDVTANRAQDRENSLVVSEVRHRLKNLLTVIRALATQTQTKGKSALEYQTAFLGRFEAVLKAEAINAAEAADLRFLLLHLLEDVGSSRLQVAPGPPVAISRQQVTPLVIILHELATNATKYGALKEENGSVRVSWERLLGDSGSMIHLRWEEHCATHAAPAGSVLPRGVGTRLIAWSAKAALQGAAELIYGPQGLVATLQWPAAEDGQDGESPEQGA